MSEQVILPCQCNQHFYRVEWLKCDEEYLYVEILDCYPSTTLAHRIKNVWRSLKGKEYCSSSVLLNNERAKQLIEFLQAHASEMLQDEW